MTFRTLSLFFFSALAATASFALDLQTARSGGQVGETLDGYVAAVKPSADAAALVADVNAKRKAEYQRISGQNGQPTDVVAKLAAPQIISGLPAGAAYQDSSGSWQTR